MVFAMRGYGRAMVWPHCLRINDRAAPGRWTSGFEILALTGMEIAGAMTP